MAQCPNVRVLALSMHADARYAAGMLMAGAKGYVVKSAAYDELASAIRAVAQGQAFLSAQVANVVIDDYARRLARGDAAGPDALTEREREIVQLIAEGHTTRSIAESLGVSGKTIDTHRQNIMSKLDLHSVAEITRYAIREGLTQDD
jgi:DNA-binding NarL/FixJ family response regulator